MYDIVMADFGTFGCINRNQTTLLKLISYKACSIVLFDINKTNIKG
jgi:hypothetical protein